MFFKLHCWLKMFACSPSVSVWGRFIKTRRRRRAMEDLTVLGSACWLVTPPMTFARTLQSLYFLFCMCRELRSPSGPSPLPQIGHLPSSPLLHWTKMAADHPTQDAKRLHVSLLTVTLYSLRCSLDSTFTPSNMPKQDLTG